MRPDAEVSRADLDRGSVHDHLAAHDPLAHGCPADNIDPSFLPLVRSEPDLPGPEWLEIAFLAVDLARSVMVHELVRKNGCEGHVIFVEKGLYAEIVCCADLASCLFRFHHLASIPKCGLC